MEDVKVTKVTKVVIEMSEDAARMLCRTISSGVDRGEPNEKDKALGIRNDIMRALNASSSSPNW